MGNLAFNQITEFLSEVDIGTMEFCAVVFILFAIGIIAGILVFDVLSKRWQT